ncbi:MAG: sugar kinase [Rhodobacteraceae bacterium]|jgi:2-dehydro-3-deoxygluconokinase|nr:MAG: sugar kinase [Paracoccaceae bacterium]|tara:strand:+ start:313 stop:1209 length:897 start_codon:yes stop_codon:yes gene_type:complete
MKILSIGECMAEFSPDEQLGKFNLGFAGDTFNTAWYIANNHADVNSAYFSKVGDDELSDQMLKFMSDNQVDTRYITTVAGSTIGLYLISLVNGERTFSYWRNKSAATFLGQNVDDVGNAMKKQDMIYFSGITLAILDQNSRENLFSCLKSARRAGKKIAFDPNLRPKLWNDKKEMCDVIMAGANLSDIILPSFEDEATWFSDADPMSTLARYQNVGAETVVVKNAGDPVSFWSQHGTGTYLVESVEKIIDSTAAGDSFNAEILVGLLREIPLADAINNAANLAKKVLMGQGALVKISI